MPDLLPSLVIVGRPNVGKSTLFNRLTGTRRAIVTNEPGITRDRIYGKAEWRGRALEIVDTQAGLTPLDEELARLLRTTGKPFVVAVNKVDAMSQESNANVFHRLGVSVFPIAAEHGTGVDDLLDSALAQCFPSSSLVVAQHAAPSAPPNDPFATVEEEKQPDVIEVAIIGRPNVGKSTLLNRLAHSRHYHGQC
jgi:GTP-binding protein